MSSQKQSNKFNYLTASQNDAWFNQYKSVARDFYLKICLNNSALALETLKTAFYLAKAKTIFVQDDETKKLIGFTTVDLYPESKPKVGVIGAIYIHDDYRGEGAGTGLLEHISNKFQEQVDYLQAHVEVGNKNGHKLFQENGGVKSRSVDPAETSGQYQLYVMELNNT